ncbi:hspc200, putative [Talaromyces stipitatus ATCC 10500]|uniref:Hspc200, putative n=1 Tax=Talaromyces stipitatus (strain ATCC 10500 / CBS 375.48 / QM 6759 / NRRL 1006) TaxID=441959 RepID=B8MUM7_TALSN|nr:hspc200, putative [Talaromyces stipitatus ATCC 10500]EED11695.1 hspc200, putative [Talaromyces stipitatus ATCC 10500]
MDVLPPPDYPPVHPSEYPQIPTRTPPATLEISRTCCDFDICDFHAIMIEAINRADVQFIKELLDHGLPMDSLYALEAVGAKRKDALEVFLKNGWDVNQPISELKPPILGYADEEMAGWLLDHGADPNRQCFIDLTPLSLAVETAHISVIQLMLRRGGDTQKGQLLHHAIERNSDNLAVLSLLIENGADINAIMYNEHYPSQALYYFMGLGTALHKAAELGKVDIVRYLISEGADLNIRDANGRTALECAKMSNHWEVIQVLEKGNGLLIQDA